LSALTVVVVVTTRLSCRSWLDCVCALTVAGAIAATATRPAEISVNNFMVSSPACRDGTGA
jgi:hypothetical protein